jgi:PKHD-type hydroxylase
MGWLVRDLNFTNEAFAYANNCFTEDELIKIEQLAKQGVLGPGELENGNTNTTYRSSTISWIKVSEESTWFYQKLTGIIEQLNYRFYRYDLTEIEDIQYSEYHSDTRDMYKPHSDDGYSFNLFRKLSVSIQLSNPEEYEGGELKFYRNSLHESSIAPKEKGAVIVFPSYVIHEVTPVTSGLRKSLVAWVQGPRFK